MTGKEYIQDPSYGGIFRFFPFEGTWWIEELLISGLHASHTKVMLLALLSNVFILIFILVYYTVSNCRRTSSEPVEAISDSISACVNITKEGSNRTIDHEGAREEMYRFYSTPPGGSQRYSPELIPQTGTALMELPDHFPYRGRKFSLKVPKVLSLEYSMDNISNVDLDHKQPPMMNPPPHPQREVNLFTAKNNRSNFTVSDTPSRTKKQTHRLPLKIFLLSLVIISALIHLISTGCFVYTHHKLLTALRQLPIEAKQTIAKAAQYSSLAVDAAYNVSVLHITNDASTARGGGHLRQIVNRTERIVADTIACFILECAKVDEYVAVKSGEAARLWRIIPVNSELGSDVRQLSDSLLQNYHLIVERLTNLYSAANILTGSFIQKTHQSWYEYRQLLSSLILVQPHTTNGGHSVFRLVNPGLEKLVDVICNSTGKEISTTLASCDRIQSLLKEFTGYVEKLPFLLPSNSLEEAVQYSLLPRALGVEQLVVDWMPVMSDLPGKGALILLQTFLLPEVVRLKSVISSIAAQVPSKAFINQYSRGLTIFHGTTMLITFSVSICELVLVVILIRRIACRATRWLDTPDRLSHTKVRHSSTTGLRKIAGSCTTQAFMIVALTLLTALAVAGIFINMMGLLSQTEFCDCLFTGQAQDRADFVLTNRIERILKNLSGFSEFMDIPHLRLSIPYPVLNTLSTVYRPNGKALLYSLNMAPPFNLSAVINSVWLNRTIMKAWNQDVGLVLQKVDIKEWLPRISLVEIFQQAVNTFSFNKKFDELQVLHQNEYLNDPGRKNYGAIFINLTKELSGPETYQLTAVLHNLTVAYKSYLAKYRLTKVTLDRIRSNKQILQPLLVLVGNASLVLDRLNAVSKEEFVNTINSIVVEGWSRLLQTVSKPAVLFTDSLLHDMVPHPGLHQLYLRAVGLLCPLPLNDAHLQPLSSIAPHLTLLGIEIFTGVLPLFIPCSAFIFLNPETKFFSCCN